MPPAVDHAVFAWDDLNEMEATLDGLGLSPDYGGPHGDGSTHMSLLGFDDGSYLEVIAPTDADERAVRWPDEIAGCAGPCSWAHVVDDIAEELKHLLDRGASVTGPTRESRERSDGTLVEWVTGVYTVESRRGMDTEAATDVLPFLIEDLTPRRYRVRPSASVAGGPLLGIEHVVLAVESLDDATFLFRRLHDYPTPRTFEVESLGARLAWFPGQPAVLATSVDEGSRVAERLDRYGPGPCAFLLGTTDLDAAAEAVALTDQFRWADRFAAWLEADPFVRRLGIVEVADA